MQCDKGFPVSFSFSGPALIEAGVGPSDEFPWMGRNSNRCNAVIVYGNVCISFGLDGVVLVSSRRGPCRMRPTRCHMEIARVDGRLGEHAHLTEANMKLFLCKVASVSSLVPLANTGYGRTTFVRGLLPLPTHRGVSPWCKWHHLPSECLKPRRKRD